MEEKELLAKGYRKYRGKQVDVYFNLSICTHSCVCIRQEPQVFKLKRVPWIMPDEATDVQVMRLIDNCPSGALQYIHK